jgi:serine protease Do
LTDEQAERFNIDEGVLVTRLGDGPASTAGLQRGDVITTLDGDAISSVDQFEELVQALPADKAIPIRVVRNERPEFLVIKVPSAE